MKNFKVGDRVIFNGKKFTTWCNGQYIYSNIYNVYFQKKGKINNIMWNGNLHIYFDDLRRSSTWEPMYIDLIDPEVKCRKTNG